MGPAWHILSVPRKRCHLADNAFGFDDDDDSAPIDRVRTALSSVPLWLLPLISADYAVCASLYVRVTLVIINVYKEEEKKAIPEARWWVGLCHFLSLSERARGPLCVFSPSGPSTLRPFVMLLHSNNKPNNELKKKIERIRKKSLPFFYDYFRFSRYNIEKRNK